MAAPLITFSGIASGIDSASLIQALMDRERSARITPLEKRINALTETNDSFAKLKTLLSALQTAADKMRLLNGGMLAKLGYSSDETVATVSAGNSAANSAYNLTVITLAKNATFSFKSSAGTYSSADDLISGGTAFNDTVTIKIGETASPLETVQITVDENMTLAQFVSEFNEHSSKALATLINIGTSSAPDYRIVINTYNTGITEGQIDVTVGATLTARGAFDSNTKNDAQNAVFSIAGIGNNIQRTTNSVSDIIPGLTLNFKAPGSATISVADDVSSTTQALQAFVEAYNKIISYLAETNLITRKEKGDEVENIFGPLATTALDENLISAIRSAFSIAGISGGAVNTLADLGITTERDGTLKFDSTVFAKALSADPQSVRTITANLGETLASPGGTIQQFIRFNGLLDLSIRSNEDQINAEQNKISDIEKALAKEEELLSARFARLEALLGKLTSQQNALSVLLPRSRA